MPHLKKIRYIICDIGLGEEGSKLISQWTAEGKITDDDEEATSIDRNSELIGNSLKDYTKPRLNSLIAVVELKRLFQGSMTLKQFVTKATLLVDEAKYPAGQKDTMVHDTLFAGISNDVVCGKIIKKGPDVTLAQVLEISRLETATQQSLSQMSHTKPTVNYVRYDKKKKNKGGKPSQQQTFGKIPWIWNFTFKQQTGC